jgi:hypothetical protein
MDIPKFQNNEDLFDFLQKNKSALIAEKCHRVKEADAVEVSGVSGSAIKAAAPRPGSTDTIQVKAIINTTKIMDSHGDVHIDGLWTKSLKENKMIYLLQEHVMSYKNIISDEVKATAETMSWKELGINYKGETQALVFDATVKREDNEYMFGKYANGKVKNHSVGMRYVKMALAINSDDDKYATEKAVWDKYAPEIVNIKDAEAQGYFWAVTEAKVVEGSAVPIGSNRATPTYSVESKEDNAAGDHTAGKQEPSADTLKRKRIF